MKTLLTNAKVIDPVTETISDGEVMFEDGIIIPKEIEIIPIRPFPTGSSPMNKKAPKVTNNGAIPLIKGYTSLKSPQL